MTTNRVGAKNAQRSAQRAESAVDFRSPNLLAQRPVIGLLLFIVGMALFAGLTYNLLAHGPLLQLDNRLAQVLPAWLHKQPPALVTLMNLGYYTGDQFIIPLAVLMGLYFLRKHYYQELTMMVVGLIGEATLFFSLSRYFDRPRPSEQMGLIFQVPGYPSGHAISVVIFYGLLAYLLVPHLPSTFWKGLAIAVALLIIVYVGVSRLLTAGHYLTDILAGYALGIAWGGAAYTLVEKYYQNRRSKHV